MVKQTNLQVAIQHTQVAVKRSFRTRCRQQFNMGGHLHMPGRVMRCEGCHRASVPPELVHVFTRPATCKNQDQRLVRVTASNLYQIAFCTSVFAVTAKLLH